MDKSKMGEEPVTIYSRIDLNAHPKAQDIRAFNYRFEDSHITTNFAEVTFESQFTTPSETSSR
ncbi:hypothetical protein [Paenibacillus physcomitrellae]|nr:hypothetical protein [Paenibacillus physcomitrellae]